MALINIHGSECHMKKCAVEARLRLLQICNTTGVEVDKAAAYLVPKGDRGQ